MTPCAMQIYAEATKANATTLTRTINPLGSDPYLRLLIILNNARRVRA
jgi:hypothetical protein